ncbi:MAG: C39 family peptidase [Roseiflexaceae bacterium]|nr:C39 family peptidase [Roseiflexaceae bacterium]
MRRYYLLVAIMTIAGASLLLPSVRGVISAVVRPEPPPQITPLAVSLPVATATASAAPTATDSPTALPNAQASSPTEAPSPTATPPPAPTPTSGPIEVGGRWYDAYIPAATKDQQDYQYSCEFDAAWVILATYGVSASVDELVAVVGVDTSVEPTMRETRDGVLIYGGDIDNYLSGDIDKNFLARSTGNAMQKAFIQYGLQSTAVNDRASVEAALRAGQLVWMKTTVDFKPWRTATWVMPSGERRAVVLGNDHAVVAIGFSERGVAIRDVLGPTSSNWNRPYEYEVSWDTFLASWGAQGFDGLAVARPAQP